LVAQWVKPLGRIETTALLKVFLVLTNLQPSCRETALMLQFKTA